MDKSKKLKFLRGKLNEISINFKNLSKIENDIIKTVDLINKTLKKNKVLVCGNGGSASDALHFSAELLGKYLKDRKALPAICLNSNVSAITAISNDYSYDDVFSRQLEGIGKSNDLLIAISTSGKSKNILKAISIAKKKNIKVVVLTGRNNFKLPVDICLKVPAERTDRIQELHISTLHLICELIEKNVNKL